jgi:Putative transposase of IS4/5 family (DUF4096)
MWTLESRPKYNRDHLRYPSDLTDDEWACVAPLIPPPKPGGGKRRTDMRAVMNAVMYILSTGCQWRLLAIVHSADIQDRDGGILLLATMKGLFPFLEKLFADSALIRGRYLPTGLPRSCRVSKPRSSNDPIKPKGSCSYPSVGSSNEPSHGSIVVAVSPRIGKISTATPSRS